MPSLDKHRRPVLLSALLLLLLAISVGLGRVSATAPPPPPQGTPEQVATLTDLRAVGTAMFHWYEDARVARHTPQVELTVAEPDKARVDVVPTISPDALAALLVPRYLPELPTQDGWGHPYEFRLATETLNAERIMAVRSAGSDGRFEGDSYKIAAFPEAETASDLVWMDGYFSRWPKPHGAKK